MSKMTDMMDAWLLKKEVGFIPIANKPEINYTWPEAQPNEYDVLIKTEKIKKATKMPQVFIETAPLPEVHKICEHYQRALKDKQNREAERALILYYHADNKLDLKKAKTHKKRLNRDNF